MTGVAVLLTWALGAVLLLTSPGALDRIAATILIGMALVLLYYGAGSLWMWQ